MDIALDGWINLEYLSQRRFVFAKYRQFAGFIV